MESAMKLNAWSEEKAYKVNIKAQSYFEVSKNITVHASTACDSDCGAACGSSCDCAGSCS